MNARDDLYQRLTALAAARFGPDAAELGPDEDFFEVLGIDSLQALDLLTELEEAFGVEVPDYELQGVNSFGGLADLLRARL